MVQRLKSVGDGTSPGSEAISESPARPFSAEREEAYIHVSLLKETRESALLVNPKASTATLLAAAHSRAESLRKCLFLFQGNEEETASNLAEIAEPMAIETVELLDCLFSRLGKPE